MTLARQIKLPRPLLIFSTLLLTCSMTIPAMAQLAIIPSDPASHGPIPDGLTSNVNSYGEPRDITFDVSGLAATVVDVAVTFEVDHTWVGDLRVTLIAPNGNRVKLFERTGADATFPAGFNTDLVRTNPITFSDSAIDNWWTVAGAGSPISAATSVRTSVPGGEGVSNPAPESSMNEFLRSNPANGTWILRFEDGVSADPGEVYGASLQLVTTGAIREVSNAHDSGSGSLRQAMTDAQAGDMITFASPFFDSPQTITLDTPLPDINVNLAIQGPGADLLTVRRAENAGAFGILFAGPLASSVTISGMTLSNGKVQYSGAGILSYAMLTLNDLHITGNHAGRDAGGVFLRASTTILDSTIDHNTTVGTGAGIWFKAFDDSTRLRLFNSTVSYNRAGTNVDEFSGPDVGGVFVQSIAGYDSEVPTLELVNSTVIGNSGAAGGVLTTAEDSAGNALARATITNSIIAGNSPDNLVTAVNQSDGSAIAEIISAGFNLSNDFNSITTLATDVTAEPLLGPLALQGGSTPVHMPLGGSPAIDNGNRSGHSNDQRGQPKPLAGADIGAVEAQSLLVTNTDDSGTGSLRAAITAANANGPELDDILFDPLVFDVPQAIYLLTALPVIDSSLTINGPRADMLTIARESSAPDMSIFETTFTPEILALSGMLLTNGKGVEFGGGVQSRTNLSLTGMHITDNNADQAGGVSLAFSNGIIKNSTIAFNTGTSRSGGIQFESQNSNQLQIINSTISNNTADFFSAIFNTGTGTVSLVNSTVAANGDVGAGNSGAITTAGDSEINLRNTILANNVPSNLQIWGPAGFIRSRGFNLSDDTSSSAFLDQPGDQVNVDAGIGPLANFGGPTPVHALITGSNAIDAGDNSGSGVLSDQRGGVFDRNVDTAIANRPGSDGTDFGAFESPGLVPIAQFSTSSIEMTVDHNALAIHTLLIENIGGGQLNVSIEPLSGSCDSPAPWLSVSTPVINDLIPGTAAATFVELDPTIGDGLSPGVYVFQLCIATNEPAQPERTIEVLVTVDGSNDVIFRDSFEDL